MKKSLQIATILIKYFKLDGDFFNGSNFFKQLSFLSGRINVMKTKVNKKLVWSAFIIYILILVWVIMFKCGRPYSILGTGFSLDPIQFGENMAEYMQYDVWERFIYGFVYRHDNLAYIIKDAVLNIVVFLPMGIYLSLLQDNPKTIKSLLIAFGISLFLELYQLITAFGSYDYLDIINNVIGCLLGILILNFLLKHINEKYIPRSINYINILVLVIFIPVLIYGIASIVINFDVIAFRYSHAIF